MRNLNGYEIGGRTLRVDNACTEKSRMEMQQLLQGPQVENPYGDQCEPEQAPEAITKTVASLPPEQMYALMKQMKTCIQNNPTEARQMLLQNPQLAYALLQAQVVMRIVDPQTAVVSTSVAFRLKGVCITFVCFVDDAAQGQPYATRSALQQHGDSGPRHEHDGRNSDSDARACANACSASWHSRELPDAATTAAATKPGCRPA